MASPEVERPMASPSNPVLSPHGLSPGAAGTSATLSSPSSNTSRKVVTFDHCLNPKEDGNRESTFPSSGSIVYHKHKSSKQNIGTSGGGSQKHSRYSHKYRQSGHRSSCNASGVIQYSADIENDDRNVLITAVGEKAISKLLPPSGGMQTHVNEQTKRFRGGVRKRSYSFSEGHFKPVSSVSSIKRWKCNHHKQQAKDVTTSVEERSMAKPGNVSGASKKLSCAINVKAKTGSQNLSKNSKFLLGGNIRDPLNLNSLSDERIARAINAVTPESSPLPTPKHRKAEYKIEVLIPPNISDPLNLMNADACEEGEYESQLLSPILARRKKVVDAQEQGNGGVGGNSAGNVTSNTGSAARESKKFRFRKRTRSAKQSRDSRDTKPPDINDTEANANATQVLKEPDLKAGLTIPDSEEVEEKSSSTRDVENESSGQVSMNAEKEPLLMDPDGSKTEQGERTSENTQIEIVPTESKDQITVPSKNQYKFPFPPRRPIPFSWKKYRKNNQHRKVNGAEIVSPVVQTPPQTPFGGSGTNMGNFRGPRSFYRGAKSGGHRRSSYGGKSSGTSSLNTKKQLSTSPIKGSTDEAGKPKNKAQKKSFEYGNYNRYYGYRNADHGKDPRLRYLNPEWFSAKDVLDIGCNVGHVTLAIARNLNPRSILGIDIDENLIRAAKQNVKHYTSCIMPQQTPQYSAGGAGVTTGQTPLNTPLYSGGCVTPSRTPSYPGWDAIEHVSMQQSNVPSAREDENLDKQPNRNDLFPICMPILYGPIDPTKPSLVPGSVRESDHSSRDMHGPAGQGAIVSSSFLSFPQNIRFSCTNYVLESDDLLDVIQPEYDTILCLSTTKWMHLNFGDEGIKRAFKRMYAQLRYGGRLILEAQGFHGYKKRKNLTSRIRENFDNIRLRPEGFREFLLHEVTFTVGETLAIPTHASQGFQRPLEVFTKLPPMSSRSASSCQTTPYYAGSSSHGATPYYMPPSPLGMFPPRVPGRPCYAPLGELTPMYSNTWPESESGYEADTTGNPSSSGNTPTASGYSPSGFDPSTTPTGYSPYHGSITPSQTPTGSGPPSTSNSPFGAHGSP